MTKNGVSANKTGKYMDKSMEVENGVRALAAVATKSLDIFIGSLRDIGGSGGAFKITETDIVTAKSSDVSVGDLGGAFKIAETDTVTIKSLDVSVGGLGDIGNLPYATKSATTITER